ncbi:MAG: hypothetical protein PHF21_03985 [Bacilli bacterium]|nr:hypothetical protein [Bacilli bacterium]
MKKNTLLILILSIILVFLLGLMLVYFYLKDDNITFYAEIKERNNLNYIISPLQSEKISKDYQEISIMLDEKYNIGDIVLVTARNEILETYPVTMTVITSLLYKKNISFTKTPEEEINKSEEELIKKFTDYQTELNSNKISSSLKEKTKNNFISLIDFVFYKEEISGYKFDELTNSAKLKIIIISLELDKAMSIKFPNYKDDLSDLYQNSKQNLLILYLEKTSEFCQNKDDICNEAKNNFKTLKNSLNLTWAFITSLKDTTAIEMQNWYEIFSGK